MAYGDLMKRQIQNIYVKNRQDLEQTYKELLKYLLMLNEDNK